MSKADLAEAGRKKLEAFRNRKKKRKEKKAKNGPVKSEPAKPVTETPESRTDGRAEAQTKAESAPARKADEGSTMREDGHLPVSGASYPEPPRPRPVDSAVAIGQQPEFATTTSAPLERASTSKASANEEPKPVSLSQSYSMLSDSYMSVGNGRKTETTSTSSLLSGMGLGQHNKGGGAGAVRPVPAKDPPKPGVAEISSLRAESLANKDPGALDPLRSRQVWPEAGARAAPSIVGAIPAGGKPEGPADPDPAPPKQSVADRSALPARPSKTLSEMDSRGFQDHIDLLTREKFELQRGLEQQQAAIDALTRENMSLTESFNANGSHASTLAGEVEELRDQVDTLASAAERALEERDAALNGSAASAERAKSLASEVIQLEERLLQARSSELKAEKEAAALRGRLETLGVEGATPRENGEGGMPRKAAAAVNGNGHHAIGGDPSAALPKQGFGSGAAATVAHSEAEVLGLLEQLEGVASRQTAATARSIFSLLAELSSP